MHDRTAAESAERRSEERPSADRRSATAAPVDDLLAATPETAYFWARVAGDGALESGEVTVRTTDETAADALASIAGARTTGDSASGDAEHAGRTVAADRDVTARESAHDASVVRFEDEYEVTVVGAPAERASAAFGLPTGGEPGGYRFDAFADHRRQLLRGLLESVGTICFRESSGSVGISFVHDDPALLATIRTHLAAAEPDVAADERSETSSGGYWFGLVADADGPEAADVAGFAEWLYEGSAESGLFSGDRRAKLRRSVERATGREVGSLTE